MNQRTQKLFKQNDVLVDLSIAGDVRAFDLLYRHWHLRWYRFCVRLTGDSQDAKDVMQEAALHIATNIVRLRDPAQFVPWSFTIIRRRAADYVRSNQRQRALDTALQVEAETTERCISLDETTDDLTQAIAQLTSEQTNLVTLFYAYGLSVNELASVFDLPPGTIKSRLYSIRQKLKALLNSIQENGHE